jgi:hypothetical protein
MLWLVDGSEDSAYLKRADFECWDERLEIDVEMRFPFYFDMFISHFA